MDPMPLLQVSSGLTSRSDGKDKLLATIQYVLMFIAAGQPGTAKDLQVKIAGARKVFRIMKPLESLTPVLKEPYLLGNKPVHQELLPKLRSICMAAYFGFDHLVWLGSVSVIKEKRLLERFQKISMWGWLMGSMSTIILEAESLLDGSMKLKAKDDAESDEDFLERKAARLASVDKKMLVLVHAVTQALLAAGLLQLRPFHPRLTATFGIVASALNCYMMAPAWPSAPVKPMTKLA